MGKIKQLLQQRQDAQNALQASMPAICSICGKSGAKMYFETASGKWCIWREAYKTEYRRFLCSACVVTISPSLSRALEKNDKDALRHVPLYDETGNMLPQTFRQQIELLPHYFDIRFLSEKSVIASYTSRIEIMDAIVLKLVPLEGYFYWIDYFLRDEGYIYTCVSYRYNLLDLRLPRYIKFIGGYENDRWRVVIDYRPKV